MSVKDRLDDATILNDNGRYEGALLSVLIAVAGTSRKRYSQEGQIGDAEAFKNFLRKDLYEIFKIGGDFRVKFRGKTILLEELLYHNMRCKLVHEAKLPYDVVFEPGPPQTMGVKVAEDKITISSGILDFLREAVRKAPENADLFN